MGTVCTSKCCADQETEVTMDTLQGKSGFS